MSALNRESPPNIKQDLDCDPPPAGLVGGRQRTLPRYCALKIHESPQKSIPWHISDLAAPCHLKTQLPPHRALRFIAVKEHRPPYLFKGSYWVSWTSRNSRTHVSLLVGQEELPAQSLPDRIEPLFRHGQILSRLHVHAAAWHTPRSGLAATARVLWPSRNALRLAGLAFVLTCAGRHNGGPGRCARLPSGQSATLHGWPPPGGCMWHSVSPDGNKSRQASKAKG